MMARENLRATVRAVNFVRQSHPADFERLVERTRLDLKELDGWQRAADRMYMPVNERTGIHAQDDSFLDKPRWECAEIPADKHPLLLYYHPLTLYRHQILKQADVVMAMCLLGSDFTLEEKRRNFDYYDPLTTRDSSLSSCVQSIVATEVGYEDKAMEYFLEAVLVNLGDIGGTSSTACTSPRPAASGWPSCTASAACVTTTANSTSTRGSLLYGRACASHSPGAIGISRWTCAPARCATGCWEGRPSPSSTRASPSSWRRVRPWSRSPASVASSPR